LASSRLRRGWNLNSGAIVHLDSAGRRYSELKLDAWATVPAMAANSWGADGPALAAIDE
jgi:hypothetical protein